MTIDETMDLLKYIDPGLNEEAAKCLTGVFSDAPLGVACHLFVCVQCGNEFIVFHPIPIKTPIKCHECGKKQAFINKELR